MFPKLPAMKPYNPTSSYPYPPCRLSPQTEPEKRALVLNTIQMALSIVDLMDFQPPSRTEAHPEEESNADSSATRPSGNVSPSNAPQQQEEEEDENYGGILATEALEEEEYDDEDCMEE
jgi:hypothetical protein